MSKKIEAEIARIEREMANNPCTKWEELAAAKYALSWANYRGWMPTPLEKIRETVKMIKKRGVAA